MSSGERATPLKALLSLVIWLFLCVLEKLFDVGVIMLAIWLSKKLGVL